MGVEYMLVDHERREYFDLGKNFGYDALTPDDSESGDPIGCYGRRIHRPASAAELHDRLRAELIQYRPAEAFGPAGYFTKHLPKIAEHIFSFLQARPNACCVHSDSSWDVENYVEVGTRYHDTDSSCLGCRRGLPKVDSEERDPLAHEHFKVYLNPNEWICNSCGKSYGEHPPALEYPLDRYEVDDTGDIKAWGPFLRRLCDGQLVKTDILPEPDPSCESKFWAEQRALHPSMRQRRASMLGFGPKEIPPDETVSVEATVGETGAFRPHKFTHQPEVAEVESFAYETLPPGGKIVLRVKNPTAEPIEWFGTLIGVELVNKENG